MTKNQARLFALVCSFGFFAIFIGLTIHTHTRIGEQTNDANITPAVIAGKDVWHQKNCINCHTILGEGAYYAPDLTKITKQRGEAYLTAFLKKPSDYYSEKKHRRVMPDLKMTDKEISDVIAFMDWVAEIDNNDWPPRPIHVTGGAAPVAAKDSDSGGTAPVAQGERVFRDATPTCTACHSIEHGQDGAGPSLAAMATRAEEVIAADSYTGDATDAAGYIRESIIEPSKHLVPGAKYSTGTMSLMPANYGNTLTDEELDNLVEYLLTLK